MTDAINEFFRSMQKFLMKKEQEYGQLRFLLSRATVETSGNIDTLVAGVVEIFDVYKILPADRYTKSGLSTETKCEPRVFQSYRCLLLNTHFHVQPRLAEDTLYGYLVDMWPALSPYLFIQIVWGLKCEELLVESILHTPLELCIEILEIASKCVAELEFERALRFIIDLIWHTYRRCFTLNTVGTQIDNLAERTQHLVANFQTLLDQMVSSRMTHMPDLPELVRYERHGIILKNLIRMTKKCTEVRLIGGIPASSQKLYALTFGNEDYHKLPAELLKSIVAILDNELITLLLNQLKQVDCHMYIAWAEVDDQNNVLLTLQRAIAIDCYYFIDFTKNDALLSQNNQLQDCLQQLAGPNSKDSILTLPELCHDIANGRSEGMKELMKRYREWDQSILDFICEWWSLLNKDDCQILFEYLSYIFSARFTCTKAEKHKAYCTVIRTVMSRCLPDAYDITITYMLRHFDHNFLELFYNHNNFVSFVCSNVNMRDPLNLKLLLVFLLLSPRQVLTVLIQIAIGCVAYNGAVFTPQDVLLVRPFLCVQQDVSYTYLTYVLRDVCMQHDHWDTKRFTDFVRAMLDAKVTSSDDIMNNVFIPYLAEKPFDEHNVNCVLINIRRVMNNCTQHMDMVALCTALVRKMSAWRKCNPHIPRSLVNEVLANIMTVLDSYQYRPHRMSVLQKRAVVDAVMAHIEPLDEANLTPLSYPIRGNILDIIGDYERRCCTIHQQLELKRRCAQYAHEYAITLKLEREDFIRHMFLHATDVEYQKYSSELAVVFWCFFGWSSEMDAYDNVLRITMEAACISLEYPHEIPYDSFVFLLAQAVRFCRAFVKIEHVRDQEETILQILLKNLSYLGESTRYTRYSSLYASLLDHLNRCIAEHYHFQEFMEPIDKFVAEASQQMMQILSKPNDPKYSHSEDIDNAHEAYRFVCACMSVPGVQRHHRCIDKIERIIFGDGDDNILTIHP